MPKRKVLQTIILQRKDNDSGQPRQVVPPIGRPFDFTAEELKSIEAINPDAIAKIVATDETKSDEITLSQTDLDARTRKAAEEAVAAFKKEHGLGGNDSNAGVDSLNANNNEGNTDANDPKLNPSANAGSDSKSAKSDKKGSAGNKAASGDDDI